MSNDTEPFFPSYTTCDEVSDICPVEATLYGDYFTTAACAIYAFGFATLLIIQAYFAGRGTSWSFTIWLAIGTVLELVGYVARTIMSYNPWSFEAFLAQNMALVLGPTFTAAATSVTFKFLVLWYGAEWSLVRPGLLPYIFVGSDFVSIMIQSAGGGMASASTGGDNTTMADLGSALLNTGVIFQVINMVLCGGLMILFMVRRNKGKKQGLSKITSHTNRRWTQGVLTPKSERVPEPKFGYGHGQDQKQVRIFVWALAVAYIAILTRCIYRVPEMTMGWGSELQKNETTFLILDGGMMLLATSIVTIIHPAKFFPFMTREMATENNKTEFSDAESHEMRPMN